MNLNREDDPADPAQTRGALINEIFICDASAEADRLQAGLRAKNYPVIDVPPGLIAMRIRYERPLAVILDADLKDAERIMHEIREASGGVTRVILLGEAGRSLDSPSFPAPLARLRYYRPIDVETVLGDLIGLLGPPQQREARSRVPRAPILMAATRRPVRVDSLGTIPPPQGPGAESESSSRYVPSLPPLQSDPGELVGARSRSSPSVRPRFDSGGASGLSAETRAVLEQGRRKVRLGKGSSSPLMRLGPTADAEVPSDSPLLQALVRPLAELFGEVDSERFGADPLAPPEAEATRAGPLADESPVGSLTPAPSAMADFGDRTNPGPRNESAEKRELVLPEIVPSGTPDSFVMDSEAHGPDTAGPETVPGNRRDTATASVDNADMAAPPIQGLARGIRERFTGALAQQVGGGLRRIILREGDIHSLFSSSEDDGLVPFLERQGRLTSETARSLGPMPHTARSAGASLVASGHLSRDELLPTLRSHAEWLLSQILVTQGDLTREYLSVERTADDGSIFGGMTGARVFVEAIQRIRTPAEALAHFGEDEAWVSLGSRTDLFAEAQLDGELTTFERARPVEFLRTLAESEAERLVHLSALLDLGALTGGPSPGRSSSGFPAPAATNRPGRRDSIAPSRSALQEQLEARLRLVNEGDYFTFFGLDAGATGVEIDRAHERLTLAFSSENLALELADRTEEIDLIRRVIDEAHLVLGNATRRARYARALARNVKSGSA